MNEINEEMVKNIQKMNLNEEIIKSFEETKVPLGYDEKRKFYENEMLAFSQKNK